MSEQEILTELKKINNQLNSMTSNQESPSKTAFDYIQMAFRYIISGFVLFLITFYIYKGDSICYIDMKAINDSDLWLILFLSGLSGIIIYAIHHAFFDFLFYWIIVCLYSKRKDFNPAKIDKDNLIQRTNKKIFFLRSQYYLRNMCNDYSTKALQREFENKMAILIFLYGCCYCMLLYPHILNYFFANDVDMDKVSKLSCVGLILFVITLFFDWRVTSREIWISTSFLKKIDDQQNVVFDKYEDKKETENKNKKSDGSVNTERTQKQLPSIG